MANTKDTSARSKACSPYRDRSWSWQRHCSGLIEVDLYGCFGGVDDVQAMRASAVVWVAWLGVTCVVRIWPAMARSKAAAMGLYYGSLVAMLSASWGKMMRGSRGTYRASWHARVHAVSGDRGGRGRGVRSGHARESHGRLTRGLTGGYHWSETEARERERGVGCTVPLDLDLMVAI